MIQNNYVFIMAGGVGSRFWPKSRNAYPKQFIDILGVGKSLLQLTYERFLGICPVENIYIVTNNIYKELIKEQLPDIPEANILCEPSRNNTAPCIAWSVFKVAAKDPNGCMIIAPSDHFILKEDVFIRNVKQALAIAGTKDALLTMGITPTRPDTGYGYIKFDKQEEDGLHAVVQFTEKPVIAKALEFLNSREYVWNAGIFIWKAAVAKEALKNYAPEIYDLFNQGATLYNTDKEQAFIEEYYPKSPNISIDYAIMEKAQNVYTMPVDIGWSDLGTWASLYQVADKDVDGQNVFAGGERHLEDTENCIIHVPNEKLAVIRGLKDFIVVDDRNVLLIYPKSAEQEIKKITETLKAQNRTLHL